MSSDIFYQLNACIQFIILIIKPVQKLTYFFILSFLYPKMINKNIVPFPMFTNKQNNTQKNAQNQTKIHQKKNKEKDSMNLLKMINEDLKRMKKTEKDKLPVLESILNSKLNNNIIRVQGKNKKINQIQQSKNKNSKHHSIKLQKTISQQIQQKHISLPKTARNQLKTRKQTLQKCKKTIDLKMTSQKVIVAAKKRKQFSHINQELIYEHRQNYLNANFNKRKSRLQKITKENKKIYERINSQRSSYSIDQLNKSYESNASISKRLSDSKISRRSRLSIASDKSMNNSRCSIESRSRRKLSLINRNSNSKNVLIKIESKNINQIKSDQIQNFATLFPQTSLEPIRIRSTLSKKNDIQNKSLSSRQKIAKLQLIKKQNAKNSSLNKKILDKENNYQIFQDINATNSKNKRFKQNLLSQISNQLKKNDPIVLQKIKNFNNLQKVSGNKNQNMQDYKFNLKGGNNRMIKSSRNSYNLLQKIDEQCATTSRNPFAVCFNNTNRVVNKKVNIL